MRHLTFWISPSLSDRSAESLSETAVTHRPQGVIIVGIYMSSNIYYYYYHTVDNRILNFLGCILNGIFHWNNVINFHGRKNGGHFKRRDAINTFILAKYCLLERKNI